MTTATTRPREVIKIELEIEALVYILEVLFELASPPLARAASDAFAATN